MLKAAARSNESFYGLIARETLGLEPINPGPIVREFAVRVVRQGFGRGAEREGGYGAVLRVACQDERVGRRRRQIGFGPCHTP